MWKQCVDWLVYNVLALEKGTQLTNALHFFIYDTVKIIVLLAIIIFAVSIVRSFFPPERTRAILSRFPGILGNIMASLLGVVTPFCSCSAVPLFLGFVEAGIPLGVTFSFLVASPMVNEIALILLVGMFGWKIALLYVVSGLAIAIVSGLVIGRLNVEKLLVPLTTDAQSNSLDSGVSLWTDRLKYAASYTGYILKTIWVYVLIGIGIGALIHGYVPADVLVRYAGHESWYAVPLAVLMGIPLYANCGGVIPLVIVLTEKGVALGTALAFMMAVTALSFPEFMILKRIMTVRLIAIFAGVVGTGIMLIGYLFNAILH